MKIGKFDYKSITTHRWTEKIKISKKDGPKREQKRKVIEKELYKELVGGIFCLANATLPVLSFIA